MGSRAAWQAGLAVTNFIGNGLILAISIVQDGARPCQGEVGRLLLTTTPLNASSEQKVPTAHSV